MFGRIKALSVLCGKRALFALGWGLLIVLTGCLCGGAGVLFHIALDRAGEWFAKYDWLLWLMPAAGLLIVLLYKLLRMPLGMGTDRVFESTRGEEGIPWQMTPLIFAGTFLTHLTGGSAGREGAALQLGGSLSCRVGKLFKLDKSGMHVIELCGMSALFSALFGTPAAAAFFAIEVVDVGLIRYKALLPCFLASVSAALLSSLCGVEPTRFALAEGLIGAGAPDYLRLAALAAASGLVAILFCKTMHFCQHGAKKLIKNEYFRALAAAALVIAFSLLLQTRDYNGAGMAVIKKALGGETMPLAWLIKLLFTAVTLSGGFRGGEIVPSFFVGACFGCFLGPLIGMDASLAAAVGMIGVFCGVTNAPAASVCIAAEMFSGNYFIFFALCAAVSFFFSGKCSLYHSQKYLESKYMWDKE